MAFFSMMRPIMLLAAPVFGGGIAASLGWRKLFYILAGWGATTLLLVWWCIPESNAIAIAETQAQASKGPPKGQEEPVRPRGPPNQPGTS